MFRIVCSMLLVLVSLNAKASTLSVNVFTADDAPVVLNRVVPLGMEITIYQVDAVEKVDKQLNTRIAAEVSRPAYRGMAAPEAHKKAFSALLNSPEWDDYYRRYGDASEAIEKAIRYRISKLPAYVFENEFVVYGVASFEEALSIYRRKVK